jgi:cytoskeletal protein CcmA (bactofilin family)
MLKRKEKTQFESPDRLNRLVEGTKIVGDLISESNIRIDGEVQGNVSTSSKVVIGENGCIKGNLNCQEADIEGKIEGKLFIDGLLILRENAKVYGDIQTVKLHIEEGGFFLGACKMVGGPNAANHMSMASAEKDADDIIY